MATSVGSANITLMPSMDGFAGKICSEFGSTGAKAGKQFGDGLAGGVAEGTSKSEGLLSKLGGAASAVGTAAAVGFGALATAVSAIGGAALTAYADYEQLVGGVDTLFGGASGTLQSYAAEAYKTCGLSANQYMTQATSFAASLVSSCGGDVARAADYANTAMGDMSDNVNKMGSNMVDVQNAYQGFAKQNYTMLDNLKLGYGGTQAEMKRLIEDANKLREAQGLNADLTIDSYADIVEAIHTVQENMGVTGTTAQEAATTISGSIGMAKASWENFLAALGRDDVDFTQITTQLLESVGSVATNVAPRVAQIGQGIIQAFPAVLAGLGDVLAPIVSEALATAWGIAQAALSGVGISLPGVDSSQILSSIGEAMDMAKLALTDPAAFMERGREIVSNVAGGLSTSIPQLVSSGLDALGQFASGFKTNFPQIVEMGGELLLGVVQGLMASLPTLIEKAPQIISDFANGISAAAETLLGIGLQIIVAIGEGLISAIPTFVANIPQIVQAAWDAFVAFQWLNLGQTLVTSIAEGIASIGSTIPTKLQGFFEEGVTKATQFATDLAGKGLQAGSDFLLNIASNLSQLPGRFAGWLSEVILRAAGFTGELGANATSAGQGFLSGLSAKLTEAVSFVSGIPGKILSALGNVGSLLWDAGSSIINGLLNGIKSAIGGVYSFVSGIAGKIASLKGPLPYDRKVLIPNGQALMQSLYSGLESGFAPVEKLLGGMADALAYELGSPTLAVSAALSPANSGYGSAVSARRASETDALGAVVSLLESIRDKDGDVYLDSNKVSAALAARGRYAMAGRGLA